MRSEVTWGTFKAFPGRTQSLSFPQSPPPILAKSVMPSILVLEKQVVSQSIVPVSGDQDVEEEAKMVEANLEKLREKNPLVLKDVSKVKADVVKVKQRPLLL